VIEGELTPKEIVDALDKYIIGQDEAKRAVAIALRNRYRRQQLTDELRDEVIPKNILMIGPTGVGKTEIARRLANLANAPFIKVEATKFTEVGYVGRDVEGMVRDLVELSIRMVEQERFEEVQPEAERAAERRLVDLLVGGGEGLRRTGPGMAGLLNVLGSGTSLQPPRPAEESEVEREMREKRLQQQESNRRLTEKRLQAGELEDEPVTVEVEESPNRTFQVWSSSSGMEEMGFNLQDMLGNMFAPRKATKETTVAEARRLLTLEEAEKLVDPQEVAREGIVRAENSGIIFLDELDKVAGREGGHGPDVSREGVQRDILPIVEGSSVMTKYGPCNTQHVLFIAAGAFHVSKPSDLIPELQGRFPLRVELKSLTEDDFRRILVEPRNSLVRQYTALLATEGVELDFKEDAVAAIARIAREVNEASENIGARRLYTLMERMLEQVSFDASDMSGQEVLIDEAYVVEKLADIAGDVNVARYML
jgi:ATP-dependent HslUV protease ATP-binding subunit HslU